MSTTVFAWDTERFLEEPTINEKGYVVGWSWEDGNKDGVYECYYSDDNGMRLLNATTPDGYQVNNRGQWVVDGVIPVSYTHLDVYKRQVGGLAVKIYRLCL